MPTERGSKPRYFVATDLQSIAGGAVPEWIQVFPYGTFDNGWETPQTIDRAFGDQLVANFDARVTLMDVPLDIQHERGPAPGWVSAIEARDDGIYARVSWTPLGKELVENREYRYISPEWHAQWERPVDKVTFANVLTRVSLTNNPFFMQMPAIAELQAEPRILGGYEMALPENDTQVSGSQQVAESGMAGAQQQAAGGPPAAHTSGQETAPHPLPLSTRGEGGTTGQTAAAGADAGALQAALAARDTQIAELRASMTALQAREARTALVADLQGRTSATNPRARLAPAQAETIADILLCVPETALTATAADGTQSQTTRRRQAADALWSIIEAGIPELGERGGGMQPATKAETAQEKSAELHRLASAKRTAQADMSYEAACRAVLAERPDLAG